MKGMTVAEYIEFLKTLKQNYTVEVGDSEFPNEPLTKESIREKLDTKSYVIY